MRYRVLVSLVMVCAAGAMTWPAGVRVRAAQAVATPLAPYTETIPETQVAFDMVPVAAGTFEMGSPESEAGRQADEGPQHTVKLPAFYMGKIEVTWDEYDQFGFSLDLQRKRKLGTQPSKEGADAVSRPTPPYADE
jgi:formylglycine-generating enzyme required for sulfatase activity